MKQSRVNEFGQDIFSQLFLIFLVLKLAGLVGWNWFIVFLPIIIYFALLGIVWGLKRWLR